MAGMDGATAGTIDTEDMLLVHNVFRRELGELPRLLRAVPEGDVARAGVVAAHALEMLEILHHHHHGEDELVWPRLRERVAVQSDLVARMEAQHEAVAVPMTALEVGLPQWRTSASAAEAAGLATVAEQLHAKLGEHLAEEEREILPLAGRTMTAAEWAELGERGLAALPKNRALVFLAHILEEATPAQRASFLKRVPPPVRVLYRLVGRRAHAKERALRG
jgi:hemerythrin-like domain-containing protein